MTRTTVFTDDFNRASLGSDYEQVEGIDTGSLTIYSSTFVGGSTSAVGGRLPCARYIGALAGSIGNDQFVSIAVTGLNSLNTDYRVGVICRSTGLQTARTQIQATVAYEGGSGATHTVLFEKVVAGTLTLLHSAGVAWTDGDRIEIEAVGNAFTVCKNGVALGGSFTQTVTGFATGGAGPMAAGSSGLVKGDDLIIGNVAAGGTANTRITLIGAG